MEKLNLNSLQEFITNSFSAKIVLGIIALLIGMCAFGSKSETTTLSEYSNEISITADTSLTLKPRLTKRPSLVTHEHKSKRLEFKDDIGDYKQSLLDSITVNTMGKYDLPEPIKEKLIVAIDTLWDQMLKNMSIKYSKYTVDIPKVDTLQSIELYKMLK